MRQLNKKLLAPSLRFTMENGDEFPYWTKLKFADLVYELRGGGTPSRKIKEYYGGSIPWVTVKDLKGQKYISCAEESITELGLKNSSAKLAYRGDLIIPTRMAVGRVLIAKEVLAINQDIKAVTLKKDFYVEFIYYRLFRDSAKLESLGSGSTVTGINIETLMKLPMIIPSYKEQQKIASFFSSLDKKLEKQQEKIEQLELFKKGMMQKIFSRELRFRDDNGEEFPDWIEERLGNLGSFKSGYGFSEKYQGHENLDYPFIKVSDMNLKENELEIIRSNHTVSEKMLDEMNLKPFVEPSIIFAKVGAAIFLERKRLIRKPFLLDNNMMAFSLKVKGNIKFYFYLFHRIKLSKMAQVGALPSYNSSDLSILKVEVPTIKEQDKICNYLSAIDLKIKKEKEKLEALQEQKKGFLQQMFV